MSESDHTQQYSAVEHYWTALPKYIAAVEYAISLSHKVSGHPAESRRHYWASVLFTRLCSAGIALLHMCPGSETNKAGTYWDFTTLAPLVRNFVRTSIMLFYLGTEFVGEDESHARLLVMQVRDCKERLRLFQNYDSREETLGFEAAAGNIRKELSSNPYFARLPAALRKTLMKGNTASILTDDQILDRMGILDQKGRAFLWFISSHADVSPLAYYRTGESNRGRGEENDVDESYIATAVDLACDFILRANTEIQELFREALAARSQMSRPAAPDARLKRVIDSIVQWEGGNIQELIADDDVGAPLLCSSCFHDEGLSLSAEAIGQRDMSKCPNCDSQIGMKLSRKSVAMLAQQFFVWGTIKRLKYGGAPTVQFNKRQPTSVEVAPWLEPDLQLIGKTLQVGFFGYGPRLWMLGEVEPLKTLQEPNTRAEVISRILNEYPGRILGTDECFYRMRKAPAHPDDFREYDPPPDEKLGEGRFDRVELPILYGSQDLEVCVHECRVTAEDEVYIATLVPKRRLRLLNLAEVLWEQDVNEFGSLDMAVHMLFLAGRHSYEISRDIASTAEKCGFDGLVYPSYFTLLRTGATPFETTFGIAHRRHLREQARKSTISNLALFGRPITDGSITVRCINRVILNKVDYKLHFGPILADRAGSETPVTPKK